MVAELSAGVLMAMVPVVVTQVPRTSAMTGCATGAGCSGSAMAISRVTSRARSRAWCARSTVALD